MSSKQSKPDKSTSDKPKSDNLKSDNLKSDQAKPAKILPKITYLSDYEKPDYLIPSVALDIELHPTKTRVKATLTIRQNADDLQPLVLNGEHLKLISVARDGQLLREDTDYLLTDFHLIIHPSTPAFTLEIVTEVNPKQNHSCDGLYLSNGVFCTQNEPEGFRRITYFLDRPDVMSSFKIRLKAPESDYPVLLANGNRILASRLEDGFHEAVWDDPFPKPCYLVAIVAGDLDAIYDTFTTKSGKKVELGIYVDKGQGYRAHYAMASLKEAMKWDEDVYNLEYDLDVYNIVAVDFFNMGAMENKGLNIFNSQYVLADPKLATDTDYEGIRRVIAHEYFHNWTGNRVTLRDWFQLTLKEGLTVYRDQEFTADMTSHSVQRIQDVALLRSAQFVEDSGPTAHPIRPASYIEINNFYTVTIYEKGAEVIRMIHTLLGKDLFFKGISLYFERYDGQAVTTDDFVSVMEAVSGRDLTQFKRWYTQAGTPECQIKSVYDEKNQTFTLTLNQLCRPIPAEKEGDPPIINQPFHYPFRLGLLDANGREMPLNCTHPGVDTKRGLIEITKGEDTIVFTGVKQKLVPSFLRHFCAPVKVIYTYSLAELAFLYAHDTDLFNRYDAGQRLMAKAIHSLIHKAEQGVPLEVNAIVLDAFEKVVKADGLDPVEQSQLLSLPNLSAFVEEMDVCDYKKAHEARQFLLELLANRNEAHFSEMYKKLNAGKLSEISQAQMGRRRLKAIVLSYLAHAGDYTKEITQQFENAATMTDRIAALGVLVSLAYPGYEKALDAFYSDWNAYPLLVNKWLSIQAGAAKGPVFETVKRLSKHAIFDPKNPNMVRALYGTFASNVLHFHSGNGDEYRFIADKILEIDAYNPTIASRLCFAFKKFGKLPASLNHQMKPELERIMANSKLSKNATEVVAKILLSDSR